MTNKTLIHKEASIASKNYQKKKLLQAKEPQIIETLHHLYRHQISQQKQQAVQRLPFLQSATSLFNQANKSMGPSVKGTHTSKKTKIYERRRL